MPNLVQNNRYLDSESSAADATGTVQLEHPKIAIVEGMGPIYFLFSDICIE